MSFLWCSFCRWAAHTWWVMVQAHLCFRKTVPRSMFPAFLRNHLFLLYHRYGFVCDGTPTVLSFLKDPWKGSLFWLWALLGDLVSPSDWLTGKTLLSFNMDKCLQLQIRWRGRLGRLRFQTSFSEELILRSHTTIKHKMSPDTIIQGKLTLWNWHYASLEPGASLGSESIALRPPTEHSGKIPKPITSVYPAWLLFHVPPKDSQLAGHGPASQAQPSHYPLGCSKDR